MRSNTLGVQLRKVLTHTGLAHVHPQRHRRMAIGGCEYGLPLLWVFALQSFHPPARMVPTGFKIAVGGRDQCGTLAKEPAQTGIDEIRVGGARGCAFQCLHRLVDQCEGVVGRSGLVPRQCQCDAQKRVGGGRWHARHQGTAQRLGTPQIAPDMEGQGLHTRAQRGGHVFNSSGARRSLAHGGDHCSGGLKLAPQGHGVGRYVHVHLTEGPSNESQSSVKPMRPGPG